MTEADARRLIEQAVPLEARSDIAWADLGAGVGTFTEALASALGAGAMIHAVERDARSLHELKRRFARPRAEYATVITQQGDFADALSLPPLSGILMANALHFVPDSEQSELLTRLAQLLSPDGRIVLVEYDREAGHRWVPYPISVGALPALALRAGLGTPNFVARLPSAFGGDLYCAWMAKRP